MIREVTDANLAEVRRFLEAHVETSLFLLSNLDASGPTPGASINSGTYRCFEEHGRIAAVWCLTRRGNLLAQTGGRRDLAGVILQASRADAIAIGGVVAEWQVADSVWQILRGSPAFKSTYEAKETLYRLPLDAGRVRQPSNRAVRVLTPDDFGLWEPAQIAFLTEEGLPVQGDLAQRRATFAGAAAAGQWWGAFEGDALVSVAGLNATYRHLAQIGGVFTYPSRRRQGLSRAVMSALIDDCRHRLGFSVLILFTGERNAAARAMYESIGFAETGHFALLFGSTTNS